jgi:hypothetical protein
LNVNVLGESGADFHEAALEGLLALGDAVPVGHGFMARSELGVRRYPAELFGAVDGALAVGVPAVVEFALVLVGPLLGNVVWTVNGAGGPVGETSINGILCTLAKNRWNVLNSFAG